MSAAAHGKVNRVFHYAVLLSIAVHGLALFVSPPARKAPRGAEILPAPIAARIVQEPRSPPPAAAPEAVKPEPPSPKPLAKPPPHKPAPAKPEAPVVPPPEPARAAPPAEPAPAPTASTGAPAQSAAVAPAAAPPAGAQTDADSIGRYRMLVIQEALKYKRYPRAAMDNNWEGRVDVRVQFGTDGRRASIAVARSSGHELLDRQAVDTITKAFVPVPAALRGKEFAIEIPVIYSLKDAPSG
jgi:protein TonB